MTKKKSSRFTVRSTRDYAYSTARTSYWISDARGGAAIGWIATRQWARDIAAMLNKNTPHVGKRHNFVATRHNFVSSHNP